MNNEFVVTKVNLQDAVQAENVVNLLNQYAKDIMGGAQDLSDFVKQNLVRELLKRPNSLVLMAYDGNIPVGLTIAFEGFSTFYAKPLINIHDFVVSEAYRGKGIAKLILEEIEKIAIERGCCKLTLEVLEGNLRAQKIYKSFGFASYVLDEEMGKALFWDKKLPS